MRRSLLLIKPVFIGAIITIGQCQRAGVMENKSTTHEPVAADTMTNSDQSIGVDTMIIDSLNAYEKRVDTTSKPKRIEHGSDNAAKLDSIKKSKTKKKH